MSSLVKVDRLQFSYCNEKVLKGLTLDFKRGKFYSIIGPNGCGKTTLLKNISKLLINDEKCIFIDKKDITKLSTSEVSRKLSVVPQNTNINYEFTVYDIVMMGRVPHKGRFQTYDDKDENIVKNAMVDTDTWKFKDKLITELSGGEAQRVVAARALAQDTEIILLDEPTSHLDIQYQIEFLKIFKKISSDKTIIAVLHDLNLVSLFSDEIIMLKDGDIVDIGKSSDVITKDNIKKVYNIDVEIIKDSDRRYILPKIN